jgi:hypothetical protein
MGVQLKATCTGDDRRDKDGATESLLEGSPPVVETTLLASIRLAALFARRVIRSEQEVLLKGRMVYPAYRLPCAPGRPPGLGGDLRHLTWRHRSPKPSIQRSRCDVPSGTIALA